VSFLVERYRLNFFSDHVAIGLAGFSAYRSPMLGKLHDRRGEPALRTRAAAALLLLLMLVIAAPLVMVPLIHWAAHQL
jgi:hypothetical protein